MAQFDVHRNTGRTAEFIPYIVELQSDFLDRLATRLVAPLVAREAMTPARYLNPEFEIEGRRVVLSIQEMASYPAAELSRNVVANLGDRREAIVGAIDVLVTGV